MLLVVPVDDINRPVRAVLEIKRDVLRIATEELIGVSMHNVKTGAEAVQNLVVDLMAT